MDGCKPEDHLWNREEPQPIAVPLLGYHPQHDADADTSDYGFVGRDHLINELTVILHETRDTRGCYLISGYRGSGKTSLINDVLAIHAGRKRHPSWLPFWKHNEDQGGNSLPEKVYAIYKRGVIKLEGLAKGGKFRRPYRWHWRRKGGMFTCFNPLVDVRVNLGHDRALSPKDVLFNTATLLHQKLKNLTWRLTVIHFIATIFLIFAFVYLLPYQEKISGAYSAAGDWILTVTDTYKDSSKGATGVTPMDTDSLPNNGRGGKSPRGDGEEKNAKIHLFLITLLTGAALYYLLWMHLLPSHERISRRLKILNSRMSNAMEINRNVQGSWFSFGRRESVPPLDERQIENELIEILIDCRKIPRFLGRPNIIFVFDELDKIAHGEGGERGGVAGQPSVGRELYGRKKKVDALLGALKNFITHGKARFFFIAGREMLDSYQAERGSTSSLYESLFNRTFEVPSLLSDPSDHNQQRLHSLVEVYVCRKLMDPEVAISLWLWWKMGRKETDPCWMADLRRKLAYSPFCLRTYYHYLLLVPGIGGIEARRIVLGLRNFIQFLTLHSWGNPKRMASLFEHFTKPMNSVDWRQQRSVKRIKGGSTKVSFALQFGLHDQQRILLASNLYTQLYHDLGRQLANSGDKLVVSTMAAFQYILKFHHHPFSRYHLERMAESLNVYRSPELNTMIDTLVSKVFHPHIRRIRNSYYRYRFNGDFAQEIGYISRVSDIESASFNFSLDASSSIKAHYLEQLDEVCGGTRGGGSLGGSKVIAHELCMTIGDLFALEQSHDQALVYYQRAVDVMEGGDTKEYARFAHFRVEAFMRLGEIYEQRRQYDKAASVYLQARHIVNGLRDLISESGDEHLRDGDSKWDIFRQPFWAYWHLHLKRSPGAYEGRLPERGDYPFHDDNNEADKIGHYRAGQLAFFYGKYETAIRSFILAVKASRLDESESENSAYLGGYASLHLGESLYVLKMDSLRGKDEKSFLSALTEFLRGISFSEDGVKAASFKQIMNKIEESGGTDGILNCYSVKDSIEIMIFAAQCLERRGLYYHAAMAYIKIISIWGMFSEVVIAVMSACSERRKIQKETQALAAIFRSAETWIGELRLKAGEMIVHVSAGGYSRFHSRWMSRDVAPPLNDEWQESCQENREVINDLFVAARKDKRGFASHTYSTLAGEIGKTLEILFPANFGVNNRFQVHKMAVSCVKEPIFMHRSLPGQKLIYLSMWGYMNMMSLTNDSRTPMSIPHGNMVPHSTRSLLFAHWLAGRRYLSWDVMESVAGSYRATNDSVLYDDAASAVHNFAKAIYYIRQLSGNDQDLIFPDPAIIYYDLWWLLFVLVKRKMADDEWFGRSSSRSRYDWAVKEVKDELSEKRSRHHSTPVNFYDFKNVTRRTTDLLGDVGNLWDISNRIRSDAIRTRYYLADDYEDPRFHLDWTLLQMYSPVAGILKNHVEKSSKTLEKTPP